MTILPSRRSRLGRVSVCSSVVGRSASVVIEPTEADVDAALAAEEQADPEE